GDALPTPAGPGEDARGRRGRNDRRREALMPRPGAPDRAATAMGQAVRLREMVAELVPANRLYAERLGRFAPECERHELTGEELLDRFRSLVGFTTKQELVAD